MNNHSLFINIDAWDHVQSVFLVVGDRYGMEYVCI